MNNNTFILSGITKFVDAEGTVWFKQQMAYLNSYNSIELLFFMEKDLSTISYKVQNVIDIIGKGIVLEKADFETRKNEL